MGAASGHFNAIGNHFLLSRPRLVQVQCSRSFFRYRREFAAGPDERRLAAGPDDRGGAAGPDERRLAAGQDGHGGAAGPDERKWAAGPDGREWAAGPDGREWAAGRSGKSRICRDANGVPIVEFSTPEFEAKLVDALSAAKHGAVLVSPCISHGEREIARQAFAAGYRVITFQNKGFSPLYKPGGKLFESCAAGNLLMLAPIKWPYQPAEKQMTRDDAQILNRIAQLVAGDGAVNIDYKGAVMSGIDERVSTAIAALKQLGSAD